MIIPTHELPDDATAGASKVDLPKCVAADGRTLVVNVPGYPLLVSAVEFNRIWGELNKAYERAFTAVAVAQNLKIENQQLHVRVGELEHKLRIQQTTLDAWERAAGISADQREALMVVNANLEADVQSLNGHLDACRAKITEMAAEHDADLGTIEHLRAKLDSVAAVTREVTPHPDTVRLDAMIADGVKLTGMITRLQQHEDPRSIIDSNLKVNQ